MGHAVFVYFAMSHMQGKTSAQMGVRVDNVARCTSNVMANLPEQLTIILYIFACDRAIHL